MHCANNQEKDRNIKEYVHSSNLFFLGKRGSFNQKKEKQNKPCKFK